MHIECELIIVEDEPFIAIMIADCVRELGWRVIGSAYTEMEAFRLLDQSLPRVALLDIKLGMETSLAVASACRDKGVAVVFITGYPSWTLPAQYRSAPVLEKPFSVQDLEQTLKSLRISEAPVN